MDYADALAVLQYGLVTLIFHPTLTGLHRAVLREHLVRALDHDQPVSAVTVPRGGAASMVAHDFYLSPASFGDLVIPRPRLDGSLTLRPVG